MVTSDIGHLKMAFMAVQSIEYSAFPPLPNIFFPPLLQTPKSQETQLRMEGRTLNCSWMLRFQYWIRSRLGKEDGPAHALEVSFLY